MQVHRFQPDRSNRSAPGKYGGAKKKARPAFDELLEKYKRIGATQKQKTQPEKIKPSLKHQEPNSSLFQVNSSTTLYPSFRPTIPWSWSYPCYYLPRDYSSMNMQPYYIPYPASYYNHGPSQRLVIHSDNLVKKIVSAGSKTNEKDNKQDSRYMQPRWCPPGLSRTQKRKLQRTRKQSMEQQVEEKPAATTKIKMVWRPKKVASTST